MTQSNRTGTNWNSGPQPQMRVLLLWESPKMILLIKLVTTAYKKVAKTLSFQSDIIYII